jgi:alpha-1,3-rhamnosyltransferase
MDKGKVSVIIPSYNHARFVTETIEGVWNQTYRPVELVVVDDASTDESPAILKALQEESPIPVELELLE